MLATFETLPMSHRMSFLHVAFQPTEQGRKFLGDIQLPLARLARVRTINTEGAFVY
jgi:hypothetical protein